MLEITIVINKESNEKHVHTLVAFLPSSSRAKVIDP